MRSVVGVGGAVLTGVAIAWVDSRPTWDDTGVTVFALLAAVVAWSLLAPRWWWIVAVAVVAPLPLLETTLL